MRNPQAVLAVAVLGAAGLALSQAPPAASVIFRDVAREAGVVFQHQASPEKKYIMESMSGGLARIASSSARPFASRRSSTSMEGTISRL